MTSPFRQAMNGIPRGSWLDRVALASLEAAEAKFYPRPAQPTLTVKIQGTQVDVWDTAKVSLAVQDATAKIGHLITDPTSDAYQSRKSYREAAPLIPRGQSGGTLFFGFPSPGSGHEGADPLFDAHIQTLSERAVLELVSILPPSSSDTAAVDAVIARRTAERSAVNDLVRAVRETSTSLGLTFQTDLGQTYDSYLSNDQAAVLEEALTESQVERKEITFEGTLDGMRTSRRIFFLEVESGSDISGAIDTTLLGSVRDNIGQRVIATVEATTPFQKSGRRGRTTYNLVRLTLPRTLL